MNENLKKIISELNITNETTQTVVSEILAIINDVYKKAPIRSYFTPNASTNAMLPGLGIMPIDLIEVYEEEDHFAFLSMFFGPKSGHELSFKVFNQTKVDLDKCKDLVGYIAGAILSKQIKLDLELGIAVHYLDEKFHTENVKAIIMVTDPILQPSTISVGELVYRLIFGINQEVYESIFSSDGSILLEPFSDFIDPEFENNSRMITTL